MRSSNDTECSEKQLINLVQDVHNLIVETDVDDPMAKSRVKCPKCSDEQTITASKVVSITEPDDGGQSHAEKVRKCRASSGSYQTEETTESRVLAEFAKDTVGVPDRHQHQYCFVMMEALVIRTALEPM